MLPSLAHQSPSVLFVGSFRLSQMVGSTTYRFRIMLSSSSMTFKSGACYYFCSPDKSFHSLFSCAESWVSKDRLQSWPFPSMWGMCGSGMQQWNNCWTKAGGAILSAFCLIDSTSSLHPVARCLFASGYFRSLEGFNLLCENEGVTSSCAV